MSGNHAHHDHHLGHGHGHSHAPPASNFAFAVCIALNLGFVVAEVIYGLTANSLALLSDATHNLSDVFGLLIAWGAIHLGKSLPTKRRTYGLRRSSILAALTNAIVLLVVVGGIAWEALKRFAHPEAAVADTIMWVAATGVVINALSAVLFMAGRKHDINLNGAFMHLAADAAVSLGVVIIGLGIRLTGWQWLDPAMSLLICLVIVVGTWSLLRESVNLAMDAVPSGIDAHAVEGYLSGLPGVESVHDLHIWGMSTTETALTAHLVMPLAPVDDKFLERVCGVLQAKYKIGHVTIQIEQGTAGVSCRQAPEEVV